MKNKNNNKIIFLILLSLIILFLIGFVLFLVIKNNESSNDDSNVDASIYEEVIIDDLEFKIDEVNYDGEFSDVLIIVKNNGKIDYDLGYVKLIFKDNDSNVIGQLLTSGVGVISSGDNTILKTSVDVDLRPAANVEYVLIGGSNYAE